MRVNSVAYMKINEAVHLRSMLYLQTLEYRADLGFKANNFQQKYTLLFTIVNIRKQGHIDFSHSILAACARPSLAVIHLTTGTCLWHVLTTHASLCLTFNSVWHTGAPVRYSTVPFYASGHVRTITREGRVQGDSLSHQWDGVPRGARDPRLDCVLGTTLCPYIRCFRSLICGNRKHMR